MCDLRDDSQSELNYLVAIISYFLEKQLNNISSFIYIYLLWVLSIYNFFLVDSVMIINFSSFC